MQNFLSKYLPTLPKLSNLKLSSWLNRANGIGLEITPERINLAQLSKQGQNYKLTNFCTIELAEGIFSDGEIVDFLGLSQAIKELITTHDIKAKRVATALPLKEAIIRIVPVPSELNDNELRDFILIQEAPHYLPHPREEVDLDYQKLNFFEDDDGIEKVNILLVGTRQEITDSYVETMELADLKLDILEVSSFSLMRTIKAYFANYSDGEAVILVDIEFGNTEIVIIVNGNPQFSRSVPIGTLQMHNALAKSMQLSTSQNSNRLQTMSIPPEFFDSISSKNSQSNPELLGLSRIAGELTDELQRSINFYLNQTRDVEIAQILLAGPGACVGNLDEFFTHRLNLSTILIDPISTLSLEPVIDFPINQRAGMGVAIGLAMRECT